MAKFSACMETVFSQPQVVLRAAISIIFWSFTMPLIGFVIFTAMTILPFLFIFFPPKTFFGVLYLAGFAPSALTAIFFQLTLRRGRPVIVIFGTGLVSVFSAAIWWSVLTPGLNNPQDYGFRALMVSAFGAALVRASHGLWKWRRHRRLASGWCRGERG